MPGPLSTLRSESFRLRSPSVLRGFALASILLGIATVPLGCGAGSGGTLDIDAVRQKAIAEGKADPLPESPTTPEARKARAEKLVKEAAEKKSRKP